MHHLLVLRSRVYHLFPNVSTHSVLPVTGGVVSAHALPPTSLLLTAAAATAGAAPAATQPPAILLIPVTQALAAKGQIVVVYDGGLHPRCGGGVHFAGGGVQGPEVRDEVIRRF
jgi:hypothetical protein